MKIRKYLTVHKAKYDCLDMMDMVNINTMVTIPLDLSECTEELLETESDQQEQLCSAWLTLIHLVN